MNNTSKNNKNNILKILLESIPELEQMLREGEEADAYILLGGLIRGYYNRTGVTTAGIISNYDFLAKTPVSGLKYHDKWDVTSHLIGQLKRLEDILAYNKQRMNRPNYKEQEATLKRIVEVRDYLITIV